MEQQREKATAAKDAQADQVRTARARISRCEDALFLLNTMERNDEPSRITSLTGERRAVQMDLEAAQRDLANSTEKMAELEQKVAESDESIKRLKRIHESLEIEGA